MKFLKEFLFIVGCVDTIVDDEDKLLQIEKGFNGIFVINRTSPYNLIRKIEFQDSVSSSGLHFSFDSNFYTVAYELEGLEKKKSKFKRKREK